MKETTRENTPLVSAIIPVFNCERFLAEAINSVLVQTYQPVEIIVVDDGSTDNTRRIAGGFGPDIRYIYQANKGPAAARNTGLKIAKGSVIGFLDADDLWPEKKVEIQLLRLQRKATVEIVLGRTQLMERTGMVNGKTQFKNIMEPQLALKLDSALIVRTAFDKIGLFDEALYHGDDWDWFMRAREAGVIMSVHNEITAYYRRHEDNLSNQVEQGNKYTLMMLKKSLDRRRKEKKGEATSLQKMSDYEEDRHNETQVPETSARKP